MATTLKTDPKQAAEEARKKAEAAKEKLKDNKVTKAASGVFAKIKEKTGMSQEKIDKFQESWLAMPKTRKKYEHLKDTPQVVGEELVAMSNDIIDFVQGKHGGHSHIFAKLKEEGSSFFHHPVDYISKKVDKGVDSLMAAKDKAKEGAAKAKDVAGKAKEAADKAKDVANQAKDKAGGAKKMADKAKNIAKK